MEFLQTGQSGKELRRIRGNVIPGRDMHLPVICDDSIKMALQFWREADVEPDEQTGRTGSNWTCRDEEGKAGQKKHTYHI
jgi:hypothetical protein